MSNRFGGVRRGEWMLPGGSLVGTPADGGDFYRNRGGFSKQEKQCHGTIGILLL